MNSNHPKRKVTGPVDVPKPQYDDAYWENRFATLREKIGDEMPCSFTPEELARELEESDNGKIADEERINSFFAWMLSK
jgi:hypothetical protein